MNTIGSNDYIEPVQEQSKDMTNSEYENHTGTAAAGPAVSPKPQTAMGHSRNMKGQS